MPKIDPKFISSAMTDDTELLELDNKKVNRSGDTMQGSLSLGNNSLTGIKSIYFAPILINTTNNGSYNVDQSTSSYYLITGSSSNFSVKLPLESTLSNGYLINLHNASSEEVSVLKNNSDSFFNLSSNSNLQILFYNNDFYKLIKEEQSSNVSSLLVDSFSINNNIETPSDITGAVLDSNVNSAILQYNIIRNTSSEYNTQVGELKIVKENNNYSLTDTYAGSCTGVDFSITSTGQLQYKSSYISGLNYTGTLNIKSLSTF